MKKFVALLAAGSLLLAGTAVADEMTFNCEVQPGGAVAYAITLDTDDPLEAQANAKFTVTVTTPASYTAPETTAEINVYTAEWEPDGTIVLTTDEFSPSASVVVKLAVPAQEATDTAAATEEVEIGEWDSTDVWLNKSYDVADQFITDVYHGSYVDASGSTVALDITYRLYVPAYADENTPLVMTMHGSGESGTDGVAHIVNNQIATCWADPEFQMYYPCYVFSPQWPDAAVSNDLELRDLYLGVYHDMIEDICAQLKPAKRYLATLSMGSRLGFRYLTLYPNAFDAAIMCCGAMQNADLSANTEMPVWLVHAYSDPVNTVDGSVTAYNQMVAAGNQNVHLTLLTDAQMNGVFAHASWQYVYGNLNYMFWLMEQ